MLGKAIRRMALFGAGIVGVAMFGALGAAHAQETTFDEVQLIVPYQEGGGSTIHARLLAPALEQALPGNPKILVRNIPGAGSVKGINEFYNAAKPDGRMIASLGTGTFFQYLLEDPAVKYPLAEFRPFLTSPFGLVVYARKDQGLKGDPIADIKKLREGRPVYGGANATSSDLPALLAIDLLGIKPQYLFGLSNAEAQAGFDRGELTLNYDNMASWANSVKPMIDEGTAVALFTFGFENENGDIVRDPMAPELPTFLEVYEEINGEPLEGTAYDVWKTLFDIRVMGSKMFSLPPGTPDHIYNVYAEAMKKALESDRLKSEQAEAVLGNYPQTVGTQAERTLAGATKMEGEQREWLKTWLKETHDVD
ncbi:Bug family tripartite tricarboxylate transporter substrate binding protein [Faunimonas sp. B44]|uniref:Bug family tripartite tricarboxylate transporter substrate binding protein n=1 Tax=Faunimonas sp. B44 TaxID=3461493 RepID=UPI004044AE77